jgi:hypothetical protein
MSSRAQDAPRATKQGVSESQSAYPDLCRQRRVVRRMPAAGSMHIRRHVSGTLAESLLTGALRMALHRFNGTMGPNERVPMEFTCRCTNPVCPEPQEFKFNAVPVTVAITSCACCRTNYQFLLKKDGTFECHEVATDYPPIFNALRGDRDNFRAF